MGPSPEAGVRDRSSVTPARPSPPAAIVTAAPSTRRRLWTIFMSSLGQHDERHPFDDDIRGKLRRVAAADVLYRVDRFGRDKQDLAGLERHRRLALEPILQHPFDGIDDLFTWMAVPGGHHPGEEIDTYLDDLPSRDAQIVLLEIGARDSRLCPRCGSDGRGITLGHSLGGLLHCGQPAR